MTEPQRQRLLSGTALEFLGLSDATMGA